MPPSRLADINFLVMEAIHHNQPPWVGRSYNAVVASGTGAALVVCFGCCADEAWLGLLNTDPIHSAILAMPHCCFGRAKCR